MDVASMLPEVRELVDRKAIHDCCVCYCRGVGRMDRELLLSAYHDDAWGDHAVFCGPAPEFADWAFAYHSKYRSSHHHHILNHTCEMAGEVAHTETCYLFGGVNLERPSILSGGR